MPRPCFKNLSHCLPGSTADIVGAECLDTNVRFRRLQCAILFDLVVSKGLQSINPVPNICRVMRARETEVVSCPPIAWGAGGIC